MKRRGAPTVSKAPRGGYLGVALCASLFVCGCFVGAAAAGALTRDSLREYLSGLSLTSEGGAVSAAAYFSRLLSACKYHIAAVFFGFSVVGVACVPGLAAVRGFFLCFTVSALTRMYGAGGVPATLAMFATCVLVTVPCFFVLSAQSFSSSLALLTTVARRGAARGTSPYGGRFFARCALCVPALAASALIDTLLLTRIARWLA
ncbi:MAG: hypothetical protein LBD92_08090 [Oscillospiraceae bacterium]|nr:hypothetical protein [Oscillospiraceae bacterium]